MHLASVGIGFWIGDAFAAQQQWISVAAGVAFLGFAAWTLRGDELSEDEAAKARTSQGAAILAVAVAFFLAELGDKTMLATITLATREGWFGTWVGSTVGMVAADALAIGVGALLGKKLPGERDQVGRSRALRAVRVAARRRRVPQHDMRPGRAAVARGAGSVLVLALSGPCRGRIHHREHRRLSGIDPTFAAQHGDGRQVVHDATAGKSPGQGGLTGPCRAITACAVARWRTPLGGQTVAGMLSMAGASVPSTL